MKRRELIKNSILGIGASALALSGCDKKEQTASSNNELNIIPKQTAQYEFSAPLPLNYKAIDEIAELNKTLKKSKVTSFYDNIPLPLAKTFHHCIQVNKMVNENIKSYNDFFKYVKYAYDKGFKFTYLMNSPKPYNKEDFKIYEKEFVNLLDLLIKHNCKDIKIGAFQTGRLINDYYPNTFNLHVSTALEYTLLSQYEYLNEAIDNLTLFDITNGENQNFKLLSALRKKFPNIKLELMVNESCLRGCPSRIFCISDLDGVCGTIMRKMTALSYFVRMPYVYPWNLEYYSALGINNFKFISVIDINNMRGNYHDITNLKAYLNCVEHGIENITIGDLFTEMFIKFKEVKTVNLNTKLSEIIDLFPDIRHFVKHGSECATRCGVDCNYCFDCAKKLESKLLYG